MNSTNENYLKELFINEAKAAANSRPSYNSAYLSGKEAGKEAGRKEAYDAFWDAYQDHGNRNQYLYGFAYGWFTDETYNPKYPIAPTSSTGIQYAFFWSHTITNTKVPIIARGRCTGAFANAISLKRIPKLVFDGATSVDNMFENAPELEELNCEGELDINGLNLQWSINLSKASILSLLNILYDYSGDTSGTVWSVTLGAENLAKLTDEEKQIAYDKGWNLE